MGLASLVKVGGGVSSVAELERSFPRFLGKVWDVIVSCFSALCPLDSEFLKPVSISVFNPETHSGCDKQEALTKL